MENNQYSNLISQLYFDFKAQNHILYLTTLIFVFLNNGKEIKSFENIDFLLNPSLDIAIQCFVLLTEVFFKAVITHILAIITLKILKVTKQIQKKYRWSYLINLVMVYVLCSSIVSCFFNLRFTIEDKIRGSFQWIVVFTALHLTLKFFIAATSNFWSVIDTLIIEEDTCDRGDSIRTSSHPPLKNPHKQRIPVRMESKPFFRRQRPVSMSSPEVQWKITEPRGLFSVVNREGQANGTSQEENQISGEDNEAPADDMETNQEIDEDVGQCRWEIVESRTRSGTLFNTFRMRRTKPNVKKKTEETSE